MIPFPLSHDVSRVWTFGLEFRGEDCDVLVYEERDKFEAFIQIPNPVPSDASNKDSVAAEFSEEPTVDDLIELVESSYVP